MTVDLSLRALVDAAGGAFFLLVGIALLLVGARSPRGRALGLLSAGYGWSFVTINLWITDSWPAAASLLVGAVLANSGAALFVAGVRKELTPARVRALDGLVLLVLTCLVGTAVTAFLRPDVAALMRGLSGGSALLASGTVVLIASLIAALFLTVAGAGFVFATRGGRGLAFAAIGLGAWPFFGSVTHATFPITAWFVVPGISVVLVWVWATSVGGATRTARNTALLLAGSGVAGALYLSTLIAMDLDHTGDYGAAGVVRTVGALFLALAFLRHDLLGDAPQRASTRRGALTATALAAVFVVAEIAQNFFSAQFGLLMGGLAAGALLVAARPIERALESRGAGPANERIDVYRDAARRSLRDGIVTREEEMHLAKLARHLAIPPDEALRIRHAVEDEMRARRGV